MAISDNIRMSSGNMERVLRLMADKSASDVYLSANTPILIKINGQILQLSDQPLTPSQRKSVEGHLLTLGELMLSGDLQLSLPWGNGE